MNITERLKNEIRDSISGIRCHYIHRAAGYEAAEHAGASPAMTRALGIKALFCDTEPYIYKNDLIAGSIRPIVAVPTDELRKKEEIIRKKYPERTFATNADHYSPDMTVLEIGITGLYERIEASMRAHAGEPGKIDFLESMQVALGAFSKMLENYAEKAVSLIGTDGYDEKALRSIASACRGLTSRAPESFYEALTLSWMLNIAFNMEGRNAMAFGRMDKYLYPFYKRDIDAGRLTREGATELLENAFIKTHENRIYNGDEQTLNICIGGQNEEGVCEVNELSYVLIDAVRNCKIPGPNLSARICASTPNEFLDACLKSIGTGIGYPALMNDEVNIKALLSFGYAKADVYNYSMVGCIENFITGMQPPWSDGRFDTPKYLEPIFGEGKVYYPTDSEGDFDENSCVPVKLSDIHSMHDFINAYKLQLESGAKAYIDRLYKRSIIPDPENYTSPFLSLFCCDCIGRGLDINMGGAKYRSAHAPGLMGVGTVVDSLAAVEKVVFVDKAATLTELADALKKNFVGYELLRKRLLSAPKYGNNDDFVDKYAVWFVEYLSSLFRKYKTQDGGPIYVGMASNVNNISSGKMTGATPDGRLAGVPLSDAASPTYGMDKNGPTSTFLSISKPDYSTVGCGSVVNQKYSPSMFEDGNREKLLAMIKVYFARGGQEVQINATSTETLRDAMNNPEKYGDLVVRVSGFSAYYVKLDRAVQEDILMRIEQG